MGDARKECRCILCGSTNGIIWLNTYDPTEFHCDECKGEFSLADVETQVKHLRLLMDMAKSVKELAEGYW